MLRDASNEIRLHPGRFAATLIAIAISIGFISAISIFISTQQAALTKSNALAVSTADVVVDVSFQGFDDNGDPIGEMPVDKARLEAVDGVAAAESVFAGSGMLTKGEETLFFALYAEPSEAFRWSNLVDGRFPAGDGEITLNESGASRLGVGIGDNVTIEDEARELTVVGLTDDPRSLFQEVGYIDVGEDGFAGTFVLRADEGVTPDQLVKDLHSALGKNDALTISTGDAFRAEALNSLTGELDIFKYLLWGFGGLALVIGMITIANTFTILVAQRRRQVALLRAVGASTGQVIGRQLAESVLLGLIGSLLGVLTGFGVAAIGATITGAVYWGFSVKGAELAGAILVGVLATVISAVAPAIRASRVKPLEALQVVPTETQAKRAGIVRIVICALALVAGVALVFYSRTMEEWALPYAMLAGVALTVAVLGLAPLYVAPVLRGLGAVFGRFSPTARLAFTNAARNPARAGSTATALMLAVGLIVTLQVGLATTRTTGMAAIDEQVPVDLTASSETALPAAAIAELEASSSVKQLYLVDSRPVTLPEDAYEYVDENGDTQTESSPRKAFDAEQAFAEWGIAPLEKLSDDTAYAHPDDGLEAGATIEVPGVDGPIVLTVVTSDRIAYSQLGLTGATFAKLTGDPVTSAAWIRLHDRTSTTQLNDVVTIFSAYPEVWLEGGAMIAGIMQQVLDVMLIVLTALLGVAVLIALVGVGNTLGLSVIERQRESALLRALGMQRAGLRAMLLIEAVALVAVGTVIGLIAGAFFGWLGVSSVLAAIPEASVDLYFAIDPVYTSALIGICLLAACLASVLPGRKAANVTPTEALAVD